MLKTLLAVLAAAGAFALAPTPPRSAPDLREGDYDLTGFNPGDTVRKEAYRGTVTISRSGVGYSLTWRIGSRQTQRGVALLTRNVLSVAYVDMSGRDAGVVSYLVENRKLDGQWCPHGSKNAGRELLVWRASPATGAGPPEGR